jgi:hypothetical protein
MLIFWLFFLRKELFDGYWPLFGLKMNDKRYFVIFTDVTDVKMRDSLSNIDFAAALTADDR